MSDTVSITKYVLQARDQLFAFLYKKNAFQKIGTLSAEYMYADEPISLAERPHRPTVAIQTGETWSSRMYGCGWFHFFGTVPTRGAGKHIVFLLDVDGEGLVYDKDEPTVGITDIAPVGKNFHLVQGKKIVEFSPHAKAGEKIDFWVEVADNNEHGKRSKFLQADIVVCNDALCQRFYDFTTLAMMKPYFSCGSRTRRIFSRAINRSEWFSSEKASEILRQGMQTGEENPYTVYATGHGHLDLAFLWPIRETKRKAVRTLINQLNNVEHYDGYVYGVSQPQQLAWIEQDHPELFARIREKIAEGRIEPQGGMWVESDANLPCGESLVRQCLYGKRYWQEKFGKDVKTCWLPDCFGFNGNLPQILKKCGMSYFLTIKLAWNDTNRFPYHSFVWKGIDGSEILAHIPPEETYSGEGIPFDTVPAERLYAEKAVAPLWSMVFGMGDGGAGPSIGHLETVKRHQDVRTLPHLKFATQESFFDDLQAYADNLPVWRGELYLERHRGTYTSQARNKFYNRKIEFLLHNVEYLAARTGKGYPEEVAEIWKEVLLYQFHDVLTGSSVRRVYDECIPRYQAIFARLTAMQTEMLASLSGTQPAAVNFTGYHAEKVFVYKDKTYIADLPPYGFAPLLPYEKSALQADENRLENEYLAVEIGEGGEFSVFDKERGAAAFRYGRFVVYTDTPKKYDAWDIDRSYIDEPKTPLVAEAAAVGVGIGVLWHEAKYTFASSTLTCRLLLREHSRIVEIEVEGTWNETHKMLRFVCEPAVWEDTVTCDIPFGNIKRPTTEKDSVDKARFEICAQKWIDIGSVAYMTEAKYGWRVQNHEVSLNLLRSPVYPDPACDRGEYHIRFAAFPHEADENPAREAYFFNNPPVLTEMGAVLPPFAETDKENVVIETVKPSENRKGVVLRLYEDRGQKTSCSLRVSFPHQNVFETDMLERNPVPCDGTKLTFAPFETKTLYFSIQ